MLNNYSNFEKKNKACWAASLLFAKEISKILKYIILLWKHSLFSNINSFLLEVYSDREEELIEYFKDMQTPSHAGECPYYKKETYSMVFKKLEKIKEDINREDLSILEYIQIICILGRSLIETNISYFIDTVDMDLHCIIQYIPLDSTDSIRTPIKKNVYGYYFDRILKEAEIVENINRRNRPLEIKRREDDNTGILFVAPFIGKEHRKDKSIDEKAIPFENNKFMERLLFLDDKSLNVSQKYECISQLYRMFYSTYNCSMGASHMSLVFVLALRDMVNLPQYCLKKSYLPDLELFLCCDIKQFDIRKYLDFSKIMDQKTCITCGKCQSFDKFSNNQLNKKTRSKCKECISLYF